MTGIQRLLNRLRRRPSWAEYTLAETERMWREQGGTS
jgi:hypothetical protein